MNPVVKMRRDTIFSREIAAGEPILQMMCTFNACCQAVMIVSVTGAAVVRCLVDHWIRYFGRPEVLFCEFGSEFAKGEFGGLCETYGFEITPRASQAH